MRYGIRTVSLPWLRMADGGWRMVDGEWRMAGGRWLERQGKDEAAI
jgi:hypothetical protein